MVPGGRDERPTPVLFGAAGWLFADLLLALAMLFLVANSVGTYPKPKPTPTPTLYVAPTPTPTAPPLICGIDQKPDFSRVFTTSNPYGLSAHSGSAEQDFANQVLAALGSSANRAAGLVQVYGGSFNGNFDVQDGLNLANGAIDSLQHSRFRYAPSETLFQPFWGGQLSGNQVEVVVFFFKESSGTTCSA